MSPRGHEKEDKIGQGKRTRSWERGHPEDTRPAEDVNRGKDKRTRPFSGGHEKDIICRFFEDKRTFFPEKDISRTLSLDLALDFLASPSHPVLGVRSDPMGRPPGALMV